MHIALSPAQMSAVDKFMIETKKIPGILLMENAARGVADAVAEEAEPCSVQVFCGVGNNGGDGLAVARILLANGYDVQVVMVGQKDHMSADALVNYAFFETQESGLLWLEDETQLGQLPEAEVYVDALFGTGLSRYVEGLFAAAIRHINEQEALVVSVDIPSGINAQTGAVMKEAVRADITVTFQYPKIGHYLFPGREYTGELVIEKIGVDEGCDIPIQATICAYESDDVDMCLGRRPLNTNKGSFGRLLLVAGSQGMSGAAVLAARAASRAGAGLVTVASTEKTVDVLQHTVPEAVCAALPDNGKTVSAAAAEELEKLVQEKTAVAAGPGLGTGEAVREAVGFLVAHGDLVKVLDADALNALAGHMELLEEKEGELILTPHPKEFAGLTGLPLEEVLLNPVKYAVQFATEYDVIVVLKGSTTVVADPFGNASLVCVGSPGMAKGGSGDVLTGLIAGFAAQGKEAYEAALMGVYVAGMAGEYAAEEYGEYSMTPMDSVNQVGNVIEDMTVDYVEADTVPKKETAAPFHRMPQHVKMPEEAEEEETPEPEGGGEQEDILLRAPSYEEKGEEEEIPSFLEKYMDEPTAPHQKVSAPIPDPAEPEEEEYVAADDILDEDDEFVQQETQEMKREILEELGQKNNAGPTRRKIG